MLYALESYYVDKDETKEITRENKNLSSRILCELQITIEMSLPF